MNTSGFLSHLFTRALGVTGKNSEMDFPKLSQPWKQCLGFARCVVSDKLFDRSKCASWKMEWVGSKASRPKSCNRLGERTCIPWAESTESFRLLKELLVAACYEKEWNQNWKETKWNQSAPHTWGFNGNLKWINVFCERSVLIKSVFTTKGNRSKSEMNTNNTSLSAILWNPIYKPMDAN